MDRLFIRLCPLCATILRRLPSEFGPRTHGKRWNAFVVVRPASSSADSLQWKTKKMDMTDFPLERVRNFSIIAHVDHGKSTLADRLLELTGTISTAMKNEQVLDKLQVERERGITVKAQTASLVYEYNGTTYLLNLIDTPGHVDFSYEVSRSLAACQGVILLVDANQGVQAQTVANFYLAFEAELAIIPVMNKIDLKVARPDVVTKQMENLFDFHRDEILRISAKKGLGVEDVLKAVIEKIPPPKGDVNAPLKALIFDSCYEKYRGAMCSVAMRDGSIKKGQKVMSVHSKKTYEIQEVGIMYPNEVPTDVLLAGHVGYLYANLKSTDEAQIGDTLCNPKHPVDPLPGFKPAKAMVFAGVFPMDQSEFPALKSALDKLLLNDSSVDVNVDSSAALGQGWRLGFLGLLHMDVFSQRLEQEYDASVIITTPNVPYKVKISGAKNIKQYHGDELTILNPCLLPDAKMVVEYQEPMVLATIITPDDYVGEIIALIMDRRGEQKEQLYIDDKRIMFKAVFPLNEIIVDFFDHLKSVTSGYASFDYEDNGYREASLIKIAILLNGREVDELTQITHATRARTVAKRMVNKLKEAIPPQLFEIVIQAKVGAKVMARENIKATRKDVLAKCYGGDITRKMKLLKRQAEGKKKMRRIGNIDIPKEAFINVLKR